jgi:hypothetical protein
MLTEQSAVQILNCKFILAWQGKVINSSYVNYIPHVCWVLLLRYYLGTTPFLIIQETPVGITNRYERNGPGIGSRWGENFLTHPERPWGPNSLRVSFWSAERPVRGVDHPSPFSALLKEQVKPNLCSPSGPSWPVLGRILSLYLSPLHPF